MDLEIPELDGLRAAAAIRRAERPLGRHTPVFAFTAHALEEDRRRRLALGMDGFITKPIRLESLRAFLSEFAAAPPRPAEPSPARAGFDCVGNR